jgi:hypothetical protein
MTQIAILNCLEKHEALTAAQLTEHLALAKDAVGINLAALTRAKLARGEKDETTQKPVYEITAAGRAYLKGRPAPSALAPEIELPGDGDDDADEASTAPEETAAPIAPKPAPLPKVQPKTSIPQPTQPQQEKTMTQAKPAAPQVRGSTKAIIEAVTNHPGIKFEPLLKEIRKTIPEITEKKLKDMTYQLAGTGRIEARGQGDDRTYHPGKAGSKKAGATKAVGQKKTKAPAKGKAAKKSYLKAAAPAPVPAASIKTPAPLMPQDQRIHFGFVAFEDGSLTIRKNDSTIQLTAREAAAIQFASLQQGI